VLAEMGIGAAWKHDRAGVLRKAAIGAGVVAALVVFSRRSGRG